MATASEIQTRIDALDAAIGSSALTVRLADGSMTTFRSMGELIQARALLSQQLSEASGTAYTRSLIKFGRVRA